jgi:hypothetical protein
MTTLVLVLMVLFSAPLTAQSPLDALRPLIGTWDTQDTYHPETGAPIVERGVRTCELVMHGSYIQCETTLCVDTWTKR